MVSVALSGFRVQEIKKQTTEQIHHRMRNKRFMYKSDLILMIWIKNMAMYKKKLYSPLFYSFFRAKLQL